MPQTPREALHQAAVARVIDVMREDPREPLTLDQMAEIACFSPFHFSRMFKELTGIPPHHFLYALRLERAKRLLMTADLSVTEICFEVGYHSLGSFTTRFTELVGLPPNSFRALAQDFGDFRLERVRPALLGLCAKATPGSGPLAHLHLPVPFDGLIFTGLFRQAIPEGEPPACVLAIRAGRLRFPQVRSGRYFAFAAAVPWTAGAAGVLTLDGAWRGRSDPIRVGRERARAAELTLTARDGCHPPILIAIPLLLSRWLVGHASDGAPVIDGRYRARS